MKVLGFIAVGILAFLAGVAATLLASDIDLLSEKINREVGVQVPMRVVNASGHEFRIPAGTVMLHKNQYREVATLVLVVTTDDLSMLRPAREKGGYQYYLKESLDKGAGTTEKKPPPPAAGG